MKKRVLYSLLIGVCVCLMAFVAAAEGLTFQNYGIYKTAKPLDAIPATYEAWVKIPEGRTASSGVLLSNARSSACSSFSIYVYTGGAPILKFLNKTPNGAYRTQKTYTFDQVDLATGNWTHLALVHDTANSRVYCYVNGELAQSLALTFTPEFSPLPPVLGGNHSSGNEDYFKGQLRSVTLYADVRTPAEIAADMTAVDTADANLMAHYDLTSAVWGEDITDAAGKADMIYDPYWYDEAPALSDYAYSIAVIGDQQTQLYRFSDTLHFTYDWLLANRITKKIAYVVNLGDYTQTLAGKASEFELAIAQFQRLSGKLPLIVTRGNHDVADYHNQYLNYAGYTSDIVGRYNDELLDIYKTARIGGTDYLFLTLNYGVTDAEIAWANEVTAAHPDHKVILVTHSYMSDDGTTTDENDGASPTLHGFSNNGKTLWEKYVSKHENIILVLSGHIDSDFVRATKAVGENGNVVTQMLINQQGVDLDVPSGLVCMLYFNEEGNVVTTQYYSTVRRQYFRPDVNNYTVFLGERSGDCNGDGAITTVDALAAISAMLGKADYKNADINGDGKVTVYDALSIMKTAVKGA
ncbi:MAG: metallophosphoesterase [Clostridia bacterium]|nr:metallophosphoesterase [Clostridia bacterium]